MLLCFILTPLVNFFIFTALSRFVTCKQLIALASINTVISLVGLLSYLPGFIEGNLRIIDLGTWVSSNLFDVFWCFEISGVSYILLWIVLFIYCLVGVYSSTYMAHDVSLPRFMAYLSLFTFFMLVLVTADNFICLFLGWEGVGLCSYLLVGFWFTRVPAHRAAMKALIVNRAADSAVLAGIIIIFCIFQSLDFSVVFPLAAYASNQTIVTAGITVPSLEIAAFLLFLGVMCKSAQFGLHVWLPDAMEGPTPVSALIHAATMVTAGVFLLIRCSPVFEYAPSTLSLAAFVGAGTALFASSLGLFQSDLKKIIAYSTSSQLGYMVFSCGIAQFNLSYFHLINHAVFKALLFLSAGMLIYIFHDSQDLGKFGSLSKRSPSVYIIVLVGSLTLAGAPFLSGFYSKELILSAAINYSGIPGIFVYTLGLLTTVTTSLYSLKSLYSVFYSESCKNSRAVIASTPSIPFGIFMPMAASIICSLVFGYALEDLFVGPGTPFFNATTETTTPPFTHIAEEFTWTSIKATPLIGLVVVVFLTYESSLVKKNFSSNLLNKTSNTYKFIYYKGYFDNIYNNYIGFTLLNFGYWCTNTEMDRRFLEVIGPSGVSLLIRPLSSFCLSLSSRLVNNYVKILIISIYTYNVIFTVCSTIF